jgi:quercetin dioxygenase-like cupin family protein
MRRAILLVAVGVTVLALVVGVALATPPMNSTTTPITRATLGEFKAQHDGIKVKSPRHSADVAIVKVTLAPGGKATTEPKGSTGWHHHPGVGLASVASGAVTFYDEECHKTVYEAGEGFLESGEEPMLVRNESNVEAVFYVTFIIPEESDLRIDDPKPEGCKVT